MRNRAPKRAKPTAEALEDTATVAEMMAELNAIADDRGITWSGAEIGASASTAERTRYATPGAQCGSGTVRLLSPDQIRYIKSLMVARDTTNLVRLPGSENIEKMSLRGASDLIDRLLACPLNVAQPAVPLATRPQVNYLRVLLTEREGPTVADVNLDTLTKAAASKLITKLEHAPRRPRTVVTGPVSAVAAAELESGIYLLGTTVYKVQRAVHGSGRMYAKKLVAVDPYVKTVRGKEVTVSHEFVYEGVKPLRDLTADHKMTLEQAKEFGALYGVCCNCGVTLTDEASIEARIGPVCAGKF